MVINLGTNDYSTQPWPSDDQFIGGYQALIADIESAYTGVGSGMPKLVLVCGPMQTTPAHCTNVQTVANQYGEGAYFININGVLNDPSTDYGCDGHPSVIGHGKMAAALAPFIQSIMNW